MADETRVEHSWYGCETGCCGYRAEYANGSSDFYTDGNVAVTLYECQFAMWYVASGKLAGGHAAPGTWKLTAESIEKIRGAVPAVAR